MVTGCLGCTGFGAGIVRMHGAFLTVKALFNEQGLVCGICRYLLLGTHKPTPYNTFKQACDGYKHLVPNARLICRTDGNMMCYNLSYVITG